VGSQSGTTEQSTQQVLSRLSAEPFTGDADRRQSRGRGLPRMLDWLQAQPGLTWQHRRIASAADAEGNLAWRRLPAQWLVGGGYPAGDSEHSRLALARGMSLLVSGDVIRPSLGWLLAPTTPRGLLTELARTRDPDGFATLTALCRSAGVNSHTTDLALRRIAAIVAAKGGPVADINIGDCLELLRILEDLQAGAAASSPYFYQLLRAAGVFGEAAPAVRALKGQGQLGCAQLIDRYAITCGPVRDLLVDYPRERQPGVDYATLHKLSYTLGRLFWADLQTHHPGIDSLRLPAPVATAWKQRIHTKIRRITEADGQIREEPVPRINAVEHLVTVRAFYLDIAEWAADDPARWGPWVAPSPIRDVEASRSKRAHRKSRMDQRTRERMPVMPVLLSTVNTARTAATERLRAAQATTAGEVFTVAGQDLRRSRTTHASAGITWAEDPHTGKRRDLSLEEHQSFWTWAAVEVLRHTVVRIEELTELSHHSLIQYTLPATGELIPLLQIAPSKTDTERLLVISPELADVLSAIVCRIRDNNGAVPLVIAYDYHERATSSAARSRWEPAAAPTPPPASTNTPASAARCPLPAARCYDPTRLNAPASSSSATTSAPASAKPSVKAGSARSTACKSASPLHATNSLNSTNSPPAQQPSHSACQPPRQPREHATTVSPEPTESPNTRQKSVQRSL